MITPALHRRWAREYLARAQKSPQPNRKRHYLRLAVSNTVRAHRLEAQGEQRSVVSADGHEKEEGSAMDRLTQKR